MQLQNCTLSVVGDGLNENAHCPNSNFERGKKNFIHGKKNSRFFYFCACCEDRNVPLAVNAGSEGRTVVASKLVVIESITTVDRRQIVVATCNWTKP